MDWLAVDCLLHLTPMMDGMDDIVLLGFENYSPNH